MACLTEVSTPTDQLNTLSRGRRGSFTVRGLVWQVEGKSIAFDTIHSLDKKYPIEAGAHIALRTIRRFLNKHGAGIECIVFAIPDQAHREVYSKVMPVYFPRDAREATVAAAMRASIGDLGHPTLPLLFVLMRCVGASIYIERQSANPALRDPRS